mmetsp:Transcript_12653/g.25286  ORF Transcript_12653/g.25286 Transcript_12653/m.25286 type:complete len:951 (+) Transcript_12653:88-2940(+)
MSSTSSTATSTGLGQSLCSCSNADCSVNLFTFPDGHEISTELRPCCGLYCKINADSRHWCAICGTNVCGLCGIANLSGADFEPLLRNVICNKHEEFCESHNLPYRQLEIPRAISADDSHADGSDEVNVGDTILDKVTPQLLQQLKSQSWAQVRTTAGFTNLLGLAIASDANMGIKSALAVGASFSPTSLGVAASALKQGKMLDTPVGQLIVSSCVVDDILALILLSMFQVLVEENPPIIAYFIPFISSLGFLLVLGGSAVTWLPKFIQNKILNKVPEQHRELTMFSIMTAMLLAYLPLLNYTKSSYLTGAFLAGATFSQIESAPHAFIKTTHQLMTWLLRVFFAASIGFQVPVKLFSDPYVIGWGFILYACVLAKFPLMFYVPQFEDVKEGASYNPFLRDRLITGLAMTCRGEFSFIIAAFALGQGLITAKIYAAIVWAVLLSCITSPFILLSLIKYFNKQQLEYLKMTNPLKQKTGSDGMTPLYLHIKSTAPASWGQQDVFRNILNDLNLEVIDRRTNRHGRTLSAEVQTDLYVKDKTMNIKFQKIAGQRRIKNALKAAMDLTKDELDTFSKAIEELQKLVDDDCAAFFMQFDINNDGVVSIGELKEGLEKKLCLKLTQRQARKVMELFDESQDGYLQEDEMVSLAQFKFRLNNLMSDNQKRKSVSRRQTIVLSSQKSTASSSNHGSSMISRLSSNALSSLALSSLEKEAQSAIQVVAKEQDQIIARGTAIEEALEKALGEKSQVVVDVWNPWPWTELFDKIASHYELETVEHFVAVFSNIDIDGGGTVDQEEIYEALKEAGVKISEEGVATLFNMIDEDGSGEIDEEEWKEAAYFYLVLKKEEKEMAMMKDDSAEVHKQVRAAKLAQLGVSTKAAKAQKSKMNLVKGLLSRSSNNISKDNNTAQADRRQSSQPRVTSTGPQAKSIRFDDDEVEMMSASNDSADDPLTF